MKTDGDEEKVWIYRKRENKELRRGMLRKMEPVRDNQDGATGNLMQACVVCWQVV